MGSTNTAARVRGRIRAAGILVVGMVLAAAFAGTVRARSIGAYSGNRLDRTNINCYDENLGAVTGVTFATTGLAGSNGSNCIGAPLPTSPRWEVGLPVDAPGTWTVTVGMRGTGTAGPFCQAYSVNQQSGIVATSSRVQQTSASFQTVSLTGTPGINVTSGGYLFVACDTLNGPDFQVGSVNWTQP